MQVADDGAFDLMKPALNGRLAIQKGEGCGVVTEQDHSLIRAQLSERVANFGEVSFAKGLPFRGFVGKSFAVVNRPRDERRGDTHQKMASGLNLPEWFESEFSGGASPAFETGSAEPAGLTHLSQFMISNREVQAVAETMTKRVETKPGTLHRRIVAQPDKERVAGKVAIGDDDIRNGRAVEKLRQQVVLFGGIAEPDMAAEQPDAQPDEGIGDVLILLMTPGAFAFTGIVNVTDNENGLERHDAGYLSVWRRTCELNSTVRSNRMSGVIK